MIFMTTPMAVFFGFIIAIIERHIFHSNLYSLNIDIFPDENVNAFISGFILYGLPFLILNYLLIFQNKRYEKLLVKYPDYDGKLFFSFFLFSLFIPLVTVIIGMLIFK